MNTSCKGILRVAMRSYVTEDDVLATFRHAVPALNAANLLVLELKFIKHPNHPCTGQAALQIASIRQRNPQVAMPGSAACTPNSERHACEKKMSSAYHPVRASVQNYPQELDQPHEQPAGGAKPESAPKNAKCTSQACRRPENLSGRTGRSAVIHSSMTCSQQSGLIILPRSNHPLSIG